MRLAARLVVIPLLTVALFLTGCTLTDPGWTKVDAGQLSLERPAGWRSIASADAAWPLVARCADAEARLATRFATTRVRAFAYEFLRFGAKQAWACLFGGAMVALIAATRAPSHARGPTRCAAINRNMP